MGNAILERFNGSGATVAGLNLESKVYFSSHFDTQLGLTLQRSRYKEPEKWSDNPDVAPAKKLFRTPDVYGYITANYNINRHWKLRLNGTLTGPMTVQHLEGSGTPVDVAVATPTYFDADLSAVYSFKILNRVTADVTAGVSNIFNSYQKDFDIGYMRDSGYIYGPSEPRSLRFTLQLSL